MQASFTSLLLVGLFPLVMLQGSYTPPQAIYTPPQVLYNPPPVAPAIQVVTVTPTVSVTIFDVITSYAEAVDTHTVTQYRNIDVINPEYEHSTVIFQQAITNRRFQAVPGYDTTTAIRSINTQVQVSTAVIPIVKTEFFYNSLTAFVTRVQQTQLYSVITHEKCDLELVTVPSFVNVVLTETLPVFVTTYYTNVVTSTAYVTVQPGYNPRPRYN